MREARAACHISGAQWLPSAPMPALRCTDTGQQQRMFSESVVSSHPLVLRQARPSRALVLTCGTPPARARAAIEVRVEESRGRKCRARDFSSSAAAAARWRACGVPQDRSRGGAKLICHSSSRRGPKMGRSVGTLPTHHGSVGGGRSVGNSVGGHPDHDPGSVHGQGVRGKCKQRFGRLASPA